jgi:hypothetical protein
MASAQGTAIVDFGPFPGVTDASVAVTGQTSISATSQIEAYLYPLATVDHSADEHTYEMIRVYADPSTIIPSTGFTIRARAEDNPGTGQNKDGVRLYGQYTVAWVWSD